jgi:amidohydrolase
MPFDPGALAKAISGDMPDLIALYRDLHANPELSMQEVRTPALLAPQMRDLGFEVTEGVGGTGVVSVLENGPGPVLMLRADMDGLPVVEQTDLPYASRIHAKARSGVETGVMHACGHDTHMAAFIGAARRLAAMKDNWSGTLVMVLQPGEETGEGARAMLEDGLFTRFPRPKYAVAFHDAAMLPAGIIGVTSGYALANVDSVDINVQGVGGHGAYPHTTRDSIVLASRIVTTLQTLVSREIDPQDPAVVTVGSFQGGAKHNIIPDEAKLQLTVRSYKPEVRQRLLRGIERIVRGESIAAGVPDDRMSDVTIRENEYTPATFNTETLAARALTVFAQHFGEGRVVRTPAVMAGEDFGRFRLADPEIESLIFWVGGTPQDQWDAAGGDHHKLPSLHSPFWAPDAEAVISTATEALTVLSLNLFAEG